MKIISAIVRPDRIEAITHAIRQIENIGITVTEVKGYGRQQGHAEIYRGAEHEIRYQPKIRLDIAIRDDMVQHICQAIIDTANTGRPGDGKIFITELAEIVRIRTGDNSVAAL